MLRPRGNLGAISRSARFAGYDFVRFSISAILLTAAALKGHQLATSPVIAEGFFDARWLLIATVEFELFFGLWLVSGLLPRLTWAAAFGCFSVFACISLYKALSGEASCGCFGRVEVNPWYTFTLDVACVLALLRWRPSDAILTSSRALPLRGTVVILWWLAAGVPAAVAMDTYQHMVFSEDGGVSEDGNLIVINPENLVGKRFPLMDRIKKPSECSRLHSSSDARRFPKGTWFVVLFSPDCEECGRLMSRLDQLASGLGQSPESSRVLFVELSRADGKRRREIVRFRGRFWQAEVYLSADSFVVTPVLLRMTEGVVDRVITEQELENVFAKDLMRHEACNGEKAGLAGASTKCSFSHILCDCSTAHRQMDERRV